MSEPSVYQALASPAWSQPARAFPPAGGMPDDPDFDVGGTWPWDWSAMSRHQAQRMWDRLEGFVVYLNHRYAWDYPQQIPMCWAFHGGLVEELTTLYWSRWAAFSGPDASPDKAQAWHTYYLPPFYSRLAVWCGGPQNLSQCRSGNHQPARQQEGRTGEEARWAQLTEQLREDDEDSRPVETIGWAQTGEPVTYPPLAVVPQPPEPPPPDYNGPTTKSQI